MSRWSSLGCCRRGAAATEWPKTPLRAADRHNTGLCGSFSITSVRGAPVTLDDRGVRGEVVCRSAAAAPIVLNLPQQKRPESNFIQLHREHSRPLVRDATCGRVPLQLRRLVSVLSTRRMPAVSSPHVGGEPRTSLPKFVRLPRAVHTYGTEFRFSTLTVRTIACCYASSQTRRGRKDSGFDSTACISPN